MDIQSLRNFEKQSRVINTDFEARLDAVEIKAISSAEEKPKKSIPISDIFKPEKSEKQPFERGFDDEDYDNDDFEDLPAEFLQQNHEQLYDQDVKLSILEEKAAPLDSFQNESKETQEKEKDAEEEQQEQAISLNSIDLQLITPEQKEEAAEQIMEQLDFETIAEGEVMEVIALLLRSE